MIIKKNHDNYDHHKNPDHLFDLAITAVAITGLDARITVAPCTDPPSTL